MGILKKIFLVVAVFIFFAALGTFFLLRQIPAVEPSSFGVTFSKIQAEKLGLDWQEAYLSILDDLKIRKLRIPVYWTEAESEEGVFVFDSVDWMLKMAEDRGAGIILAVGRKLPRWPECHIPDWVRNMTPSDLSREKSREVEGQNLLNYIETTVKRYDEREVVWAWQVENEPFLRFGECPHGEIKKGLDEEIALVRLLSDKPIIITDSGEFGDWFRVYGRADIFGSTMYRHVYSKWIGEFTYPIPSFFFRLKLGLAELFYGKKPVLVVELQAEPWGKKLIEEMTIEEHYELFNPERFSDIMEYISGTGFDTFYFWGAEWWYWLKEQGHPELWNSAKEIIFSDDD